MTQSLWFLGARFNIIADATTTGGQYDLIEGYFPPGIQTPIGDELLSAPGDLPAAATRT